VDWARTQRERLDAAIQEIAWDGQWFIWATGADGTIYGTHRMDEGKIYINTQTWAVLSGAATPEQARLCMKSMKDHLATPYGLTLCAPPFKDTPRKVMDGVVFNAGIKENGGIFNHPQSWAVMAECMLGNGDQAYEYYRAYMPSAYNTGSIPSLKRRVLNSQTNRMYWALCQMLMPSQPKVMSSTAR
jgi:cellobiose phosphorylase